MPAASWTGMANRPRMMALGSEAGPEVRRRLQDDTPTARSASCTACNALPFSVLGWGNCFWNCPPLLATNSSCIVIVSAAMPEVVFVTRLH